MSNIPWYEKISRCIQTFTGDALASLRVKPVGESELITSGTLTLAVGLGAVAQNLDLEYDPVNMSLDAIGDYMVVIYNPSATVALSVAIQGWVDVVGSANPQYFNLATGTVAAATTARFMVPGLFSSTNGARVAITPAIGVDLTVEVFVYRALSTQPVDIVVTGEVSIPDEVDVTFNGTMTVVEEAQPNVLAAVAGSKLFDVSEIVLTTEQLSSAISLVGGFVRKPGDVFQIQIDKPAEDTAGDMTVTVYNVSSVDDSNARNCKLASFLVPKIAGLGTFISQPVSGLFIGNGTIVLGFTFATDSNAGDFTVYYKIFRQ